MAAAGLVCTGGELDLVRGQVTAAAELVAVSEVYLAAMLLASVTCVHGGL